VGEGDDPGGTESRWRGSRPSATPAALARELGISPSTLRAWLRRTYGRADGARRWVLTSEQIAAAGRRWRASTEASIQWNRRPAWNGEVSDDAEERFPLTMRRARRRARRGSRRLLARLGREKVHKPVEFLMR